MRGQPLTLFPINLLFKFIFKRYDTTKYQIINNYIGTRYLFIKNECRIMCNMRMYVFYFNVFIE